MVPEWCEYFTHDEYESFAEEVDGALSCFGADGQDIDAGFITLAVGEPEPELLEFGLGALAQRCRDNSTDDWEAICFSAIDSLTTTQPQQDWLARTPFAQAEPHLRPWRVPAPQRWLEAAPDHPDQPFAAQLPNGTYLHLLATIPELEDIPQVTTFVTNAVIHSWQLTTDDLLHWDR